MAHVWSLRVGCNNNSNNRSWKPKPIGETYNILGLMNQGLGIIACGAVGLGSKVSKGENA